VTGQPIRNLVGLPSGGPVAPDVVALPRGTFGQGAARGASRTARGARALLAEEAMDIPRKAGLAVRVIENPDGTRIYERVNAS
jgi:hypothetical protein